MSNRLASWGAGCRSPQASRTTIGMKPWEQVSTHVARTQPLVLRPVRIRLSIPHVVNVEASDVPKNALGYCLEMTSSSGRTSSPSGHAPMGLPARKFLSGLAFW